MGGDKVKIAENIKALRQKKGISQYVLAKKSNKALSQSQISKIEKGSRKITENDLEIISSALGVSMSDLVENQVSNQ